MDSNVLKSSISSRRSSIRLYSAMSRITAAGLPSRKTTSGLFLFVLLRIFDLLRYQINTLPFEPVYYSPSEPPTKIGAPGPTRTGDLRIRSPTLYPTELRARVFLWLAHERYVVLRNNGALYHVGYRAAMYPMWYMAEGVANYAQIELRWLKDSLPQHRLP